MRVHFPFCRRDRRFPGGRLRRGGGHASFLERAAQLGRKIGPRKHLLDQFAPDRWRDRGLGVYPGLSCDLDGLKLERRRKFFRRHSECPVSDEELQEHVSSRIWRRHFEAAYGGGVQHERVRRAQEPRAELLRIAGRASRRALKQRFAHRLDAHPRLAIGVVYGPMLVDPQRGGSCDLRRCRRGPVPVKIDDGRLAKSRPWNVGRISGHGRRNLAARAVVAGHAVGGKIGVWRPVGHHAAGRDHATEPRRIDDITSGQVSVVVSGRRHDDNSRFIKRVYGIGPNLRRQAAHTHADNMHARLIRCAQLMYVVEPARDRAVAEQDDPVGDANRDDVRLRRASEGL